MAYVAPGPGLVPQLVSTVSWVLVLLAINRCCPAPVPESTVTVYPTHWLSAQLLAPSTSVFPVPPLTVPLSCGGFTILYTVVLFGTVVQAGVTVSWVAVFWRMTRFCPTPVPPTRYAVQPAKAFAVQAFVLSVRDPAAPAVAVPEPVGAAT